MNKEGYIVQIFQKNGLDINETQAELLYRYYTMLVEKNKVMNLTAITEFEDVVIKHFVDSAILNKVADLSGKKIIDVGTGAGFPGIPLRIINPDVELTLVDSLNKRVLFLREVINELGLTNTVAIHSRAEDLARDTEHREQYDTAVSRAVSNLATLVEYTLPFVKIGGAMYAYKGAKADEELLGSENAIKILGGKTIESHSVNIADTDYERKVIEIRKESHTVSKYPRSGNKPLNNPLT